VHVGIDASNLRAGGGVTHLLEILRMAVPGVHGIDKITVWCSKSISTQIEDKDWLEKKSVSCFDKGFLSRFIWQQFELGSAACSEGCNVLLVPGGFYLGSFHPYVVMCRNMLPFDNREANRFGLSLIRLRLFLLRIGQKITFKNADGLIFLTKYAEHIVFKAIRQSKARCIIIPHGVADGFKHNPRKQRSIIEYSLKNPFQLLYVSIVDVYKHQGNLVQAVCDIAGSGIPLHLDLIGPAHPPCLNKLKKIMQESDPRGNIVTYHGSFSHQKLSEMYIASDMFAYASSCENMPNILLEAMASGLPIACSDRGPMPEVLGDAGVYFDPENITSIKIALYTMLKDPVLREKVAQAAFLKSQMYSWRKCAGETMAFVANIAENMKRKTSGNVELPDI
jgi:glycosyltransferase involved in cell wall biosynthesis